MDRYEFFRQLSIPQAAAFEWLTTWTEHDHDGPRFDRLREDAGRVARRVLRREPGSAELEDRWGTEPPLAIRILTEPPRRIRIDAASASHAHRADWLLDDGDGGAVVRVAGEVEPRGVRRLLGTGGRLAARYRADAEAHLREMEDELAFLRPITRERPARG